MALLSPLAKGICELDLRMARPRACAQAVAVQIQSLPRQFAQASSEQLARDEPRAERRTIHTMISFGSTTMGASCGQLERRNDARLPSDTSLPVD